MMPSNTVPTARRNLCFKTIPELLLDVDTLAGAESARKLRPVGQWTFGQILNHLATFVDYAYIGMPFKVPFFLPWIARLGKGWVLKHGMPAGAKIPGVKGGTLAKDIVPWDQALPHFRTSFARLDREMPAKPHPMFGTFTHAQWIQMHLRHSELHLSFLRAD